MRVTQRRREEDAILLHDLPHKRAVLVADILLQVYRCHDLVDGELELALAHRRIDHEAPNWSQHGHRLLLVSEVLDTDVRIALLVDLHNRRSQHQAQLPQVLDALILHRYDRHVLLGREHRRHSDLEQLLRPRRHLLRFWSECYRRRRPRSLERREQDLRRFAVARRLALALRDNARCLPPRCDTVCERYRLRFLSRRRVPQDDVAVRWQPVCCGACLTPEAHGRPCRTQDIRAEEQARNARQDRHVM